MDKSVAMQDGDTNFFSSLLGTASGAFDSWLNFRAIEAQSDALVEATQATKNQQFVTGGETYTVGGFAQQVQAGATKYGAYIAVGLVAIGLGYAIFRK